MRISHTRFIALMATIFVAAYGIAFFATRYLSKRPEIAQVEAPVAATPEEESGDEPSRPYADTADRVTIGSGFTPDPPQDETIRYDQMLRQMASLPDGEAKIEQGREIGAIRDRAVVPLLLEWATTTTDRGVLRAALEALSRFGDEALIDDIKQRYARAFRHDDRYRLAKVVKNIANPEAEQALIALAEDADAAPALSAAATDALATIATPASVSALLQKIESAPPDEAPRLATAIMRIDQVAALSTLQYAALGNKDAESMPGRVAAIQALSNYRDEETRKVLEQLIADPSEEVRTAAASVIAKTR